MFVERVHFPALVDKGKHVCVPVPESIRHHLNAFDLFYLQETREVDGSPRECHPSMQLLSFPARCTLVEKSLRECEPIVLQQVLQILLVACEHWHHFVVDVRLVGSREVSNFRFVFLGQGLHSGLYQATDGRLGAERVGRALAEQQCLHLAGKRLNQVVDVVAARTLHAVHQACLSKHLWATVSVHVCGHRHRLVEQLLLEVARSRQLRAVGPQEQHEQRKEHSKREDETIGEPHENVDGNEHVTAVVESLERRRCVRSAVGLDLFTARVHALCRLAPAWFLSHQPRGLYIDVEKETHEKEAAHDGESHGKDDAGRLRKSTVWNCRRCHGNVLLLEEHVGQVDVVGSLRVLEVNIERLVGMLAPVGYTERHVELGGAENEKIVTEYLLQVQTVVYSDPEEGRAVGHVSCKHRLYALK